MKILEFIFKNIDLKTFLKLSVEGQGCSENEIIESVKDPDIIKNYLYHLKFGMAKALDDQEIINDKKIKTSLRKFLEKKIPINNLNIERFFFNKNEFIYRKALKSLWSNNQMDTYGIDVVAALQDLVYEGVFFHKVKGLSPIYEGYIDFKESENYQYRIICFYWNLDKKYRLMSYLLLRGNYFYKCIKKFNKKPTYTQIENSIFNNHKKSDHWDILKLESNKKNNDMVNFSLREVKSKLQISKYLEKDIKKAMNIEKEIGPDFKNEEEFVNYYAANKKILYSFLNLNPEKYFKKFKDKINLISVLKDFYLKNPKLPFKKCKLLKHIITNYREYKNSIKFIEKFIYYCSDLEGFLKYVPFNIQNNKKIKNEIGVLKLMRIKNKKKLIKILRQNKQQLEGLVQNYLPKGILKDKNFMLDIIKIDKNMMIYLDESLKNNVAYMKQVNKLVS